LWIDDGSEDSTLSKLKAAKIKLSKDFNIKIISHKKNYGYGRTIRNSFALSNGDYLITYDSDCTYDYKIILELINKSQENQADMVNVSYVLGNKDMNVSFVRNLISKASILIYKLFFLSLKRKNISYYNCSFRIYNLDKFKSMEVCSDDFNACAEVMIRACELNYKILEIAGENIGRKYGSSKMRVLKNILNHFYFIFSYKINFLKKNNDINNGFNIY
jgi:glycosyltransferase involved in cell wall biosynthesis